jgi:nucleoside-diphosphate-sugar epimerase
MGWEVTGLGRNPGKGQLLARAGVRFVQADLADRKAVADACAGQDYVFHSGALSSPWGTYRDYYASNVEGTRHVVEGVLQHGVQRLIHVSTPSLYFDYRDRLAIRESDPLPERFVNAYAATKRLAEELVLDACQQGLAGVILRPRAIFGPGDNALFPRLLRANTEQGIPMIDGGNALLDLTYVSNVVDAMLLGCSAPESALGRSYNITNGEPVIFREVVTDLLDLLDIPLRARRLPYAAAYGAAGLMEAAHRLLKRRGEPVLTRYSVGVLSRSQTLDITEARERLGYAPRVSMQEGMQAFARWWKEREA